MVLLLDPDLDNVLSSINVCALGLLLILLLDPSKTNCEHTGKIIFLDLILNPIPLLLGSEESMLDKEAFGCSKET